MVVINRERFQVDLLPPLIETAAAAFFTTTLMTTQISGHLAHHLLSPQSVVVITAITSFASALIQNFIENDFLKYLSIPMAYSFAILSHRFIYPGVKWNHIIDLRGTVAILTIITLVKVIIENGTHLQQRA
jgi:hypothetical protein